MAERIIRPPFPLRKVPIKRPTKPLPHRPRGRDTRPDRDVLRLVDARAGGRCEGCGVRLGTWWSRQHRKARGMGGSRDTAINAPSNLLVLCGSATSPGGCHAIAESRNALASVDGWWLERHEEPASTPVRIWDGRWVLLTDGGGYEEVEEA